MRLHFILASLVCLLLLSCNRRQDNAPRPSGEGEEKSITQTVGGIERRFVVYLPEGYANAGKMPMLFVVHGGGGTPEDVMNSISFKPIADREKVVLVYPAGIQKNWNDGRPTEPNQSGINDVGFFNQMCDYMIANYPVEGTRIYATGISNGGFMCSRLGCELSSRVAAVAVVAATIEKNTVYPSCNPGRPVPALYIHGTTDPIVPFAGGQMTAGAGGVIVSHAQAVEKWVSLNKCSPTPAATDLPNLADDGTTIKERRYSGGTNGSEVVSYVVTNGGHTWPQGTQRTSEALIGKTSQDMNACEVIWAFCKRFTR